MRSAIFARAFRASWFCVVVGVPACSIDTTGTEDPGVVVTDALQQVDDPYASCPWDPPAFAALSCATYHPGSTMTAYCALGACFEMTYGDEVRLVAADELGAFPKVWFAWHEGVIAPSAGLTPCVLTNRGNKTRLEIPVIRCAVALTTAEHLYYLHFASNPTNGCLGWVECKQY